MSVRIHARQRAEFGPALGHTRTAGPGPTGIGITGTRATRCGRQARSRENPAARHESVVAVAVGVGVGVGLMLGDGRGLGDGRMVAVVVGVGEGDGLALGDDVGVADALALAVGDAIGGGRPLPNGGETVAPPPPPHDSIAMAARSAIAATVNLVIPIN